ncbi:MAG: M20/M25/M40 family metallo-hydrolase [Candidatus Marinamargulisbacteria bacterium]
MLSSYELLMSLLAIPSPTYGEEKKTDFLMDWFTRYLPAFVVKRVGNNIIATHLVEDRPNLAFVGHTDTVPDFFSPYKTGDQIYGSGASDMQSGLASFLTFVQNHLTALIASYGLTIILYDKEEGTPIHENGLNELIRHCSDDITAIDMAIVAEPTNNTIQLGCVGSLHYTVRVTGQAAHSARPWHGENALYKALPLIQNIAAIAPKKQSVFGVDFFDVIDITESQSTPGRTTVPEAWTGNINYRFSPVHSLATAKQYVEGIVQSSNVSTELILHSAVDAGQVIDTPLLTKAASFLTVEAKQAWTDVAQLTAQGVCAFNFGPGRQDQAHVSNECVFYSDMVTYENILKRLLLEA